MFHQKSLLSVPSICQFTELDLVPFTLESPPPPPVDKPANPVLCETICVKSRPLLGKFCTTVSGKTVACTSLAVSSDKAAAITSMVCAEEETASFAGRT